MNVLKDEEYQHKDGDVYIVRNVKVDILCDGTSTILIEYAPVTDINDICVRTQKHFLSSFVKSKPNKVMNAFIKNFMVKE